MSIEIKDLKKQYKNHVVLDGINMTFKKPGIYLIAGPNGSGKTTLLELIIGLRKPTSGNIKINGYLPDSADAKKELGFLSQQNSLRKNCKVSEELDLVSEIFGIREIDLEKYLEKFDLRQYYHHKTRKLSGGSKRRLLLAMTLLPKQKVIVLDEPASGLDSFSRNEIWNIITEISKDRIVIVSDHYLNQAAQYSDYVYLMDKGRIALHGHIDVVTSSLKKTHVIKVREGKHVEIEKQLQKLGFVVDLKISGTVYSYYLNVTDIAKLNQLDVKEAHLDVINFEDVYFYYTGKYSHDGGDSHA